MTKSFGNAYIEVSIRYPGTNPNNNQIDNIGLEISKRYRLSSRWRIIHTKEVVLSICSEYTMPNTWLNKHFVMESH